MLNSIRRRLLVSLLLVISMIGILTIWMSYRESVHEVQELFDAQLAQSARVLLSILQTRTEHEDFRSIQEFLDGAGIFPAVTEENNDEKAYRHNYERKVAFQLWDKNGGLLLHSANVQSNPLSPAGLKLDGEGFKDEKRSDGEWRIFSVWDESNEYLIQVGERYDIRGELVDDILYQFFTPALVSLPLLAILIWWSISKAMQPLYRIRDAISVRDPNNLDHMQLDNVPEEVAPLVAELNSLFDDLNKAFEIERRFTDDAAHELRTPLSALKTQVQVAQRAESDSERMEALKNIVLGVDRMTYLLNQMLTLARLDSVRELELVNIDLSELISAIIKQLSAKITQKNIAVEFDSGQDVSILTESVSLEMLLRNLIDNAIKYTPENGNITIDIKATSSETIISITDAGPGLDPELYERVFERYFRKPGQRQNGSGLGLSIARRCADLLGAKLNLEKPASGSGLMVRLYFSQKASVESL